jgi:hypothetical protein
VPRPSLPKSRRVAARFVADCWRRGARWALVALAALASPGFAHNLGQEATFLNFDRPTLDQFAVRAATSQPLVKAGDVVGMVLKSTPGPGTATGAGGYMTFYLPGGVQVVGVDYVREDPAQPGSYNVYPLPGPAIMPIGAGPIGPTCPASPPNANLRGVTLGPNVLGVSEKPVTDGAGCHRGTIAGVYADIGVFYSTDPRTVYGSYAGGPLTNNRGIVTTPTTQWDAFQLLAYGVRSPCRRSSIRSMDAATRRGVSRAQSPVRKVGMRGSSTRTSTTRIPRGRRSTI